MTAGTVVVAASVVAATVDVAAAVELAPDAATSPSAAPPLQPEIVTHTASASTAVSRQDIDRP